MISGRVRPDWRGAEALPARGETSVVRRCLWMKVDPAGMDHAELDIGISGLEVSSMAFGTVPVPYRLDLDLTVAPTGSPAGWR
jgi:hypothetical protein